MKISDDVLGVLDRCHHIGNTLFLPPERLERERYLAVNKVIEAAGGKWNRRRKGHVFEGEAADAIEPIILTGEVVSAKTEFGFFETPAAVVERLLAIANVKPGMICLEPSAGRGAIAAPLMRVGVEVHTVEQLQANVLTLQRLGLKHVCCGNFLEQDIAPVYHRVVMNPPFAKQADIKHVMWARNFLRPGGRLVSVMSAGVQFRADRRTSEFRDLVDDMGGSIERLPDDSFKSSGTSVNTVIVTLNRT